MLLADQSGDEMLWNEVELLQQENLRLRSVLKVPSKPCALDPHKP